MLQFTASSHSTPLFTKLRAAAVARGLTPATGIPEASEGRAEEATFRPARIVEGETLQSHSLGAAEPWQEPVAFLDGVQRQEVIGHLGAVPLVGAVIAAAVRERRERRFHTVLVVRRRLAIGRPDVLAALKSDLGDMGTVELDDVEPVHPVRDLLAARRAVDGARGKLEVELGLRYRENHDSWLVVDGALSEAALWARDARVLGVTKSHATLPFEGKDLELYLRLPCGYRSSVFAHASSRFAPVYSWALRLWPWEGKDLFHSLVRIEAAPTDQTIARADQISRWLLAERAPLSTPDPRWDRLLYGIHDVETYLKVKR